MLNARHAARAYETNSGFRSTRAQEAEIFRHANAGLRRARAGSSLMRVRALADNERLWTMVVGLVRDPANVLPPPLLAGIASVGLAVLRDMQLPSPDFEFLISMNEDIAAGLSTNVPADHPASADRGMTGDRV